jgi:RNA polymerase sigma-70 factor (ECF subfamily)
MPVDPRVEDEVRAWCERDDCRSAVTIAIRDYGPEVFGFLVVLTRDPSDAGDVFADVCVRIWKGLTRFEWKCSLRTWIYILARRAYSAFQRERAAYRERHVRISDVPGIDEIIARIRTTTLARLHQEHKTRAERIREKLSPDEQALLTLRLDRNLEWREIVRVLDDREDIDDDTLTREAAALRKRFERLKERLKLLAAED